MSIFPEKELQAIQDNCEWWGNNCGGCETCDRAFGKHPPYDFEETYRLIMYIRHLENKLNAYEQESKEPIK